MKNGREACQTPTAQNQNDIDNIPVDQRPIIPVEKRFEEIEKYNLFKESTNSSLRDDIDGMNKIKLQQ